MTWGVLARDQIRAFAFRFSFNRGEWTLEEDRVTQHVTQQPLQSGTNPEETVGESFWNQREVFPWGYCGDINNFFLCCGWSCWGRGWWNRWWAAGLRCYLWSCSLSWAESVGLHRLQSYPLYCSESLGFERLWGDLGSQNGFCEIRINHIDFHTWSLFWLQIYRHLSHSFRRRCLFTRLSNTLPRFYERFPGLQGPHDTGGIWRRSLGGLLPTQQRKIPINSCLMRSLR